MSFESFLNPKFIELLGNIHQQGFKVGVVGGTVRDFFLGFKNKHDYDCELRLISSLSTIEKSFQNLSFGNEYKVNKLPYNILKIEHPEFTCELTLPRIEEFDETFRHSNFKAKFVDDIDYELAFSRRDFTINSMMYEFNGSWKFIDPFMGKDDLSKKTLKPCSENFFKDPVRFLRAIRFKNILGFSLEERINERLTSLSLEDFSSHYLRTEALKSKKPISFLFDVFEATGTKIDQSYREFIKEKEVEITDLKQHLNSMVFLQSEQKELLFDAFDYSLKVDNFSFPINLSLLSSMSYEAFSLKVKNENIINCLKKICKLDTVYFNYLYELKLIDLEFSDIQKLNSLEINLDGVKNKDKSMVQMYKKLEQYFKDKKSND